MNDDPLVLDNSVLSSFYQQDWLHAIEIHHPDCSLIVPQTVWEEFIDQHDIDEPPSWMQLREVIQIPFSDAPKALSNADLACIGLAEEQEGAVIANDKLIIDTANNRNTACYWGTEFLIKTFELCGMSQNEFDDGVRGYIEDVYLPDRAENQLLKAEKLPE